jgi:MFS family permease
MTHELSHRYTVYLISLRPSLLLLRLIPSASLKSYTFPSFPEMATTTTLELQKLGPSSGTINTCPPISTAPDGSSASLVDASSDVLPTTNAKPVLSKNRAIIVITQLIILQLFSSFCNGIIVVGLPSMTKALNIEAGLLLWPTSVFYLTAGSCLMLAGSIADVVGTRPMILAANVLLVASALACGFARTGGELIAFRGLQGVANAMAVPASVSIISTNIVHGRPRNLGFSCLGFSSPLGFLLGLVLGGVFVDTVGWRPAFYLAGATTAVSCVFCFWVLPQDPLPRPMRMIWKQLASDIDWMGTIILSAGIAILSYVLA